MPADDRAGDVTEDGILGGRLRLRQPKRGHRVGHDAILLAAACPARAGERVVDLGAGVGAAGLALATRVPDTTVTLVEIDPALAALAAANAERNDLAGRVRVAVLDVAAPARAFAAAGLAPESDCARADEPAVQRSGCGSAHRPTAGAASPTPVRATPSASGSGPRRGCCGRAAR